MTNSDDQSQGQTKKCPYCAEDILDEAIKCKHCGSDLRQNQITKQNQPSAFVNNKDKKALKWIGKALLLVLAIVLWYISIPTILIWYIWKKSKLDKKKKYIGTALAGVLFGVLFGFNSHINRTPSLEITEPNDGFTVQSSETTVKGTINPENATLTINGVVVKAENGEFNYKAELSEKKNVITLKVLNSNGQSEQNITINRTFTEEELVEYERRKAEEEAKNEANIEAQRKVEQEEVERKKTEEEANSRIEMIEKQFSAWNGSHIKLSRLIKDSMNDPDSYEHIETKYWDMKDHLIVNTTFRGKNAFGGTVKNTVKAKVSFDGENVEILEQY